MCSPASPSAAWNCSLCSGQLAARGIPNGCRENSRAWSAAAFRPRDTLGTVQASMVTKTLERFKAALTKHCQTSGSKMWSYRPPHRQTRNTDNVLPIRTASGDVILYALTFAGKKGRPFWNAYNRKVAEIRSCNVPWWMALLEGNGETGFLLTGSQVRLRDRALASRELFHSDSLPASARFLRYHDVFTKVGI